MPSHLHLPEVLVPSWAPAAAGGDGTGSDSVLVGAAMEQLQTRQNASISPLLLNIIATVCSTHIRLTNVAFLVHFHTLSPL